MPLTDAAFLKWRDSLVRASSAWHLQEFEKLDEEDRILRDVPICLAARSLCETADDLCEQLGDDALGDVIWFAMGHGLTLWHQVAGSAEPAADQIAAVLALKALYEQCFAKRLIDPADGTTDTATHLGGACYMLWDMDDIGGIVYFSRPPHLVDPCFEVLEFALALDSPPCQLSALHGLGHICRYHRERVESIIGAYLRRNQDRPLPFLRPYAMLAREAGVQ